MNTKKLAVILTILFLGTLLLEACAASKPGFNSNRRKGSKVHSSGSMYNKKK